jgi:hypothetical protein
MKLIVLVYLFLVGCAPNIIDIDSEKLEHAQIQNIKKTQSDPFKNEPTANQVKVADNDDVYVEVIKGTPFLSRENVKLDIWTIYATNRTEYPKCVLITWKVQDFELESELPFEFIIKPRQSVKVGKMKQTMWSFDNTFIALPPSGYVDNMRVRHASLENGKLTCDEKESEMQEPITR